MGQCKCTGCEKDITRDVIYRNGRCPVLNNVVYDIQDEASRCKNGEIGLVECDSCGLVFNVDFNVSDFDYDDNYESSREYSGVYNAYIDEVVGQLSSFIDKTWQILEIGCGQGEFLKKLCEKTGAKGKGYDNAYKGNSPGTGGVDIAKEYFAPENEKQCFDAVILRHVLEHLGEPVSFLRRLTKSPAIKQGTLLIAEVPDLEWIMENGAYIDITYEHCNYFTKASLATMLADLGFGIENVRNVYGGQYILLSAYYGRTGKDYEAGKGHLGRRQYDSARIDSARVRDISFVRDSGKLSVWGASGKGVVFLNNLPDEILKNIEYVIDINPNKQEKYLPRVAKKIFSPDVLRGCVKKKILVMNGVYKSEIIRKLSEIGANADVIAWGELR
ncbi:MAG: methyltransferase domain-containing protein [Candidatus Omnitrophica bacterium]|nr:methyltransferase domain-containing protein [Candidatus Omnitrophota bacterium]